MFVMLGLNKLGTLCMALEHKIINKRGEAQFGGARGGNTLQILYSIS